jgi:CHAT domain-containing protein
MKLLFLASNPKGSADLALEREISVLQKELLRFTGESVSLVFLPDLPAEEFQPVLDSFLPDVLHIVAHSDAEPLQVARADHSKVTLAPQELNSWLSAEHPPKLVYLNSCNSQGFASTLAGLGRVKCTIGSTARILNGTARKAAVNFYRSVANGHSIGAAFEAAKATAQVDAANTVTLTMFGRDAHHECLNPRRALGAKFIREEPTKKQSAAGILPPLMLYDEEYKFRLYVTAAHPNTSQVVFFTDDSSFIDEPTTMENDMSLLVRGAPRDNREFWAHEADNYIWSSDGDHRLFAVGITPSGESFSVAGSLKKAVELHYNLHPDENLPDVQAAVRML